jgi:hypothetical protein
MNGVLTYETSGQHITVDLTRSAPNQLRPFPHIDDLCKRWELKGYREVLDLGCGQLRNSLVFVRHFRLWVCDFPEQFQRAVTRSRLAQLQRHPNFLGVISPEQLAAAQLNADAAAIAYVLHTLPEVHTRVQLIQTALRNTKAPHEIFIAVPNGEYYYRQHMSKANQLNDGYLFSSVGGRSTFYREYSAAQLDAFLAQVGFTVDAVFPADHKVQRTYLRTGC